MLEVEGIEFRTRPVIPDTPGFEAQGRRLRDLLRVRGWNQGEGMLQGAGHRLRRRRRLWRHGNDGSGFLAGELVADGAEVEAPGKQRLFELVDFPGACRP